MLTRLDVSRETGFPCLRSLYSDPEQMMAWGVSWSTDSLHASLIFFSWASVCLLLWQEGGDPVGFAVFRQGVAGGAAPL